jgi:hypothetical protein
MPVISFDTGAFSARMAEFKAAAQQSAGGHAVQKMANKGGVDVATINATSRKYVEGVQRFNAAMRAMQIQNPSGAYRQLQSDLQSAVSSMQSRPKVATAAQTNFLSRSKVSTML